MTNRNEGPRRHLCRREPTIRKVEGGFPHSEIPGSKLVRSSPRLIAAYHVLHRLSAPRHPPNALKALDRSRDRCPHSDPQQQSCCRSRTHTGHKKTGDRPLSRSTTLCLPNMTAGPSSRPAQRPHSLFTISISHRAGLGPSSLQTCLSSG